MVILIGKPRASETPFPIVRPSIGSPVRCQRAKFAQAQQAARSEQAAIQF